MSNDETFEKFKGCAWRCCRSPRTRSPRTPGSPRTSTPTRLDLVELVMALEETFDVSVDETELEGIETIGQAYDLIAAKL